jgi:hypothetical protein
LPIVPEPRTPLKKFDCVIHIVPQSSVFMMPPAATPAGRALRVALLRVSETGDRRFCALHGAAQIAGSPEEVCIYRRSTNPAFPMRLPALAAHIMPGAPEVADGRVIGSREHVLVRGPSRATCSKQLRQISARFNSTHRPSLFFKSRRLTKTCSSQSRQCTHPSLEGTEA